MQYFEKLSNSFKHFPGYHTSRKIVVIESDDWGSIRMPSLDVFNKMIKEGFDVYRGAARRYNQYDSLETSDDLLKLFEVLSSVKDCNGNYCVFTPMCLVANPDFNKIRDSGFQKYFYEPFTETLSRYPGCEKSFKRWKEGISSGLFIPQFHGREHLNINRWINALKAGDKDVHFAFKNEFWGYPKRINYDEPYKSFQAAFDFDNPSELFTLDTIIKEGLDLFNQLFGYNATCFAPTNGPLSQVTEKASAEKGIKFLQTAHFLYFEPIGFGKTRKSLRYLGKRNKYDQVYLVRNCFFEPSELTKFNWIDKCLNDIGIAFKYRKPAIINSHRVNYIGALDPENRNTGLKQLKMLLKKILKKYPDVEFLTSSQLGNIIIKNGSEKD